jgi:hypothetical protein
LGFPVVGGEEIRLQAISQTIVLQLPEQESTLHRLNLLLEIFPFMKCAESMGNSSICLLQQGR